MIDIVLVSLFCYQLNRLAKLRGISPLPYVLNYLAAFSLMMLVFMYLFLSFYGANALKDEQGIKTALMFEPFAIMFEVFLFIYFRKRIQRTNPSSDDNRNDFNPPPSPPKEKKDLSYFR
jgi:glucan phosphoethanolaminetransferase (alkaline phosphatase superfamily)